MYKQDETVVDTCLNDVQNIDRIDPNVVDSWLEQNHDVEVLPFLMGDGDYVTGVCWTG